MSTNVLTQAAAKIAIMIVDDHHMFGEALASALTDQDDFDVVGVASSLAHAREMLRRVSADVLLLDQRLPDGRGTQAVSGFRSHDPNLKVLMLSAAVDDAVLSEALLAGCAGYVNKAETIEYLAAAVRAAHAGATSISPELLDRLVNGTPTKSGATRLTPRELSILAMLAEGLSPDAICAAASITHNTLRNHTQNILSKLDVHSKLEAVTEAIRQGLVSAPDRDGP